VTQSQSKFAPLINLYPFFSGSFTFYRFDRQKQLAGETSYIIHCIPFLLWRPW